MSISSSAQALSRLEPYLLLAKSAKGAAAARLIADVTAATGCYVFSELFDVEGIRALKSDDRYCSSFRLLELFAFGTYKDYVNAPSGTYPAALDEAQLDKLRQLTLVTCATKRRNLAYHALIAELGLEDSSAAAVTSSSSSISNTRSIHTRSIRQLEDVIINAIYAGIISARLDQSRLRVEVESVMGRDVPADQQEVERLSEALREWQTTTIDMLALLQDRIEDARQKDIGKNQRREAFEQNLEQRLGIIVNNAPAGGQSSGAQRTTAPPPFDSVQMETDEDGLALRKKK